MRAQRSRKTSCDWIATKGPVAFATREASSEPDAASLHRMTCSIRNLRDVTERGDAETTILDGASPVPRIVKSPIEERLPAA